MGEIIRKDAAIDAIIEDAHATVTNANARGGEWKSLAEERLAPILLLLSTIDASIGTASAALAVAEAALEVFDGQTDDFLGHKADEMWNLVGRPGFDPAYALIWPGGASAYSEGSDDEQPDRMELLASLLDAGIHPKLDPAWGKAAAAEVLARVATYREKLAPVLSGRTKTKILMKAKTVLARAVQMELARLKRRYLSEGFSDSDVHSVIPDRPRAKPVKQDAKPDDPPTDPN